MKSSSNSNISCDEMNSRHIVPTFHYTFFTTTTPLKHLKKRTETSSIDAVLCRLTMI